jgi:hypothetical protein
LATFSSTLPGSDNGRATYHSMLTITGCSSTPFSLALSSRTCGGKLTDSPKSTRVRGGGGGAAGVGGTYISHGNSNIRMMEAEQRTNRTMRAANRMNPTALVDTTVPKRPAMVHRPRVVPAANTGKGVV